MNGHWARKPDIYRLLYRYYHDVAIVLVEAKVPPMDSGGNGGISISFTAVLSFLERFN